MNRRKRRIAGLAVFLLVPGVVPVFGQTLTVTSGLQLWLKADAGVTAGGGGVVSAWADQSGMANHANQASGDQAPVLVSDAGNGKPALRFDGVDDFLEVADSDSVSIAGDITTFYAVRFTDFETYRAVWAKTQVNQPAPNDWYALPGTGIPRAYRGDGTGLNEYADGGKALPAGKFLVAGYDVSGSKLTHYHGASPTGSGHFSPHIPVDADTSLVIGSRDDKVTLMKGEIAEILIYNRALTLEERISVVSYLGMRFLYGGLDPAADTDQDGLTNQQEEALGTDPTVADTDDDGLSDGSEVNTHKSNPVLADSDGDLLVDGYEVNVLGTDPAKADTDSDGFNDHYEVHFLTNPKDPNSKPKRTLVNQFTGPDAGEGLDLDGTFLYAINVGGTVDEPGGQIRDAVFTADDVAGSIVAASQAPAVGWNTRINFGDSADEQTLNLVIGSIRWSAAPATLTQTFENLEIGASYKLQLLFSEYRWPRGYDVSIQGRPVADEFAPFQFQGGGGPAMVYSPGAVPVNPVPRTNGVVITHSFIATKSEITVSFAGAPVMDPVMTDHNPILNAATLEVVEPRTDTDNDGLSDPWEREYFGNLEQNGDSDGDVDGLKNSEEFTSDTDPTNPDTDGDGLNDGAEVAAGTSPITSDTDGDLLTDGDEINTYKTNPLKSDTDDDGLSDGAEVNIHATDPNKKDTDSDGTDDGREVATGTDPTKNEVPAKFTDIAPGVFFGGDPGEGLDLQGNFLYAINIGTAGAAGKAGDANFTAETVPGVKVTGVNQIPAWGGRPTLGDSANDDVIELVTHSIRYDGRVTVEMGGLVPDSIYKLQLLFKEQGTGASRGFDVYADGTLLADNFLPFDWDGGGSTPDVGSVISAQFTTYRNKLVVILDGLAAANEFPDDSLTDSNAILDGVTLEIIQGGIPTTPPTLSVARSQSNITVTFEGTLQSADSVNGAYTDSTASSPAVLPTTGTMKYYRAVRK